MNLIRIWAIILRHIYPYRYNWPRIFDITFWPFLDLLVFGYIGLYFNRLAPGELILALFLAAILLWNLFFRVQQGISVTFLMELWSRNLTNIFVSPISTREYLAALLIFGLMKVAIVGVMLWAAALLLFHINVFAVGISLVPLIIALILFGWAIGMFTTAVILRLGQSAEVLAWAMVFFFQPFGAIFWPVSLYPEWLQSIVWWMPLPHIFEALRSVFAGNGLPTNHLVWAYSLNALYILAVFFFFGYMFEQARDKGYLLKAQD